MDLIFSRADEMSVARTPSMLLVRSISIASRDFAPISCVALPLAAYRQRQCRDLTPRGSDP
jgi:hypothetical protein